VDRLDAVVSARDSTSGQESPRIAQSCCHITVPVVAVVVIVLVNPLADESKPFGTSRRERTDVGQTARTHQSGTAGPDQGRPEGLIASVQNGSFIPIAQVHLPSKIGSASPAFILAMTSRRDTHTSFSVAGRSSNRQLHFCKFGAV
jgi:hypothetical protein